MTFFCRKKKSSHCNCLFFLLVPFQAALSCDSCSVRTFYILPSSSSCRKSEASARQLLDGRHHAVERDLELCVEGRVEDGVEHGVGVSQPLTGDGEGVKIVRESTSLKG